MKRKRHADSADADAPPRVEEHHVLEPEACRRRHCRSPSRTKAPACASSRRARRDAALRTTRACPHPRRCGGHARAGTFAVVPSAPFALPGLTPNPSLSVPNSLSTAARRPVQLSYADSSRCGSGRRVVRHPPGRCSRRSTRSSRTGVATWGRARRARSLDAVLRARGFAGRRRERRRRRDPWNPTDAVFSAARYLARRAATTISIAACTHTTRGLDVKQVLSLADLYGGTAPSRSRSIACRRTSTLREPTRLTPASS